MKYTTKMPTEGEFIAISEDVGTVSLKVYRFYWSFNRLYLESHPNEPIKQSSLVHLGENPLYIMVGDK